MGHYLGKIFLLLSVLWMACTGNDADNQLIVRKENTVLRAEPDEKSKEIKQLAQGERLLDLEQTATHESVLKNGEGVYQSPWIKVSTSNQQTGWVLAWSVKPLKENQAWLLEKRMATYWGKSLLQQRNQWCTSLSNLHTAEDWLHTWRQAVNLRDTMMELLIRRPKQEKQLSYQWAAGVLPGFVFQQAQETGQPHLFADFRFWQAKALATTGKEDDVLTELYLSMFPADSIESAFPVWTFPLDEQTFASQLGQGRHLALLQKLDLALREAPVLQNEIQEVKNMILEDILDRNRQYWQAVPLILKELDAILSSTPAILTSADLDALQIRRAMFVQAAENGIRVDMRSGY
ncbi:MAG TPA: SH3 domain-containing protein [Saprospiraceae bacterium]|nr:SH3 domain-containing protein [Saprospiraceae bacterium]